jgi:drug/metabolite transporter (DMT)-like permease
MTSRKQQLSMDLLLLLVTLFWGTTFIIVKQAVAQVEVFAFLTARFGSAFILMVILFRNRIWPLRGSELQAGTFLGIFLFAAFAFQTWGLTMTTATNGGFFTGLCVVMVPILSLIFLRRPPAIFSGVGVVFASVGLYILTGGGPSHWNQGDLLVFICAIWVAVHILLTGYYASRHNALALATWQIGTCALLSLIFSLGSGTLSIRFPASVWGAVGMTSILCTVLAYAVQTYAQRFTPPTRTALIFTAEPVFGALFAHWYGGELLLAEHMLGGGFIFLGMVVSEIRPSLWKGPYGLKRKMKRV